MKSTLLALSLLLLAIAGRSFAAVEEDQVGPTVTVQSPAIGAVQHTEKAVVSGTVKDNKQDPTAVPVTTPPTTPNTVNLAGVSVVQYRFAGSKKWRNALIIPGATTGTTTADSIWAFTIKVGKGKSRGVSIRAKDKKGNFGDVITIKVKRARFDT